MRFLLLCATLLLSLSVNARRYQRPRIDIKLPTQKLIEAQEWSNVAAGLSTKIVNANDGPSSASAVTISSGLGTLDYARNLTVQPGDTTADVASCTVTVSGTDYNNDSISEAFAFSANQTTAVTGAKAFKTVTSVAFAASCEDSPFGATWNVGSGDKLGLSRCMDGKADWIRAIANNSHESTAPTVLANTSTIESNTIDFDTSYDGSNDFKLYFVQSYGCD